LEELGYQVRSVPLSRLDDLRQEIEAQHQQGLFDEQFYEESLTWFDTGPPENLPQARSLMVVAVPRPQIRLVFAWQGEELDTLVPSYYLRWREVERRLREALASVLEPLGHQAVPGRIPEKLLAVRSGLARYGRNNVSYVEGLGSFHRLWSFYSDLDCQDGTWREPELLVECENCSACRRKCPTGAITSERFLLRAERCLTYHNEMPGEVPFPTWIDPAWHNCLVGCCYCQNYCPANKEYWGWIEEGVEFSEQETALLLEGLPLDQLPEATVARLEELDLVRYVELLPRNLGALLDGRGV
jgi:epoxyqueuosine reductase